MSGAPVVAETADDLRKLLADLPGPVALVPTMGALHEGHRTLVRAARGRAATVVVSVFVNPTQFGPNEDLSRYPRPFEADVAACRAAGVDLIFHPPPEEIYPPGFRTFVEVTGLQDVLEGVSRPGHFRGVATVCLKLFTIVYFTPIYALPGLALGLVAYVLGRIYMAAQLSVKR